MFLFNKLIDFFNKDDVYIGYSLEELYKVQEVLRKDNIKYTYKVINLSGRWLGKGTTRSNFGSFGVNMKYEKQYILFVNESNSERARYLINKVLHP